MNLTRCLAALMSPASNDQAGRPISRALTLAVIVWAAVIGAGIVWTWHYKTTPGMASGPPAVWPESVPLRRAGMTLVMTLHPRCTCSQASISELARLMASVANRPTVYALFVDSDPRNDHRHAQAAAERTTLWERAAAIPGVTTIADPRGAIANSFGAATSGDVIAYAPDGTLVFHGGLTAARGHEGDSFGRQRLLAALRGDTPDRDSSPVFGCPLHDTANSTAAAATIGTRSDLDEVR